MNNKIVSIKKTSALFLAIVLVTGTITALSSSSFMIGADAQAQPYYGMDNRHDSYHSEYPSEYKDSNSYSSYEPDYGMDDYKKPQIFPANKIAELGDRWWQWISGVDSTVVNPL